MALKDFFIKPAEVQNVGDVSSILKNLPSNQPPSPNISINLIESINDIQSIDDLYKELDMSNSNKIYDVSPFIDSLPSSMDMVSKKTSLAKILQAAKYNIDELKINADNCISAIEQANLANAQNTEIANDQRKTEIQSKLLEIQNLESEIEDESKKQTQQGLLFNEEILKLKTIKGYLE